MGADSFNQHNFHKYTFCIFTEVSLDEIESLKPNYKSKSGSQYYFTETGLYRLSNHWGRAANCKWRLQTKSASANRTKLGFALWSSFQRDNDTEQLYFIDINFENNSVNFEHKDGGSYDGIAVLRTASETTRRIRQIRSLLENDSWTKYYPSENAQILKENVIRAMVDTNKPLQQIKSELKLS